MNYRPFGNTGLEVSEIGLGAYPMSGMQKREDGSMFGWSGTSDVESISMIHRAEELGVNLIDSAERYGSGHSEILIGTALQNRRDKWIVATKVAPNIGVERDVPDEAAAKKLIREACEGSLKRLGMETIDLYQLHSVPHEWAMPSVMAELAKLKEEGKVAFYGISTNNQEAIEKLRAFGPIEVLQIGYNLLERSADALLHWAKQENIGTLIRVPLAKGMLTGKYFGENAEKLPEGDLRQERFLQPEAQEGFKKLPQLGFLENEQRSMVQAALRFVLDHPGVSCAIAGAKNPDQVDHNVKASEIPPLSDEELDIALPIADSIGSPGWT